MLKAESLFRAVIRNAAILLGGRAANGIVGLAAFGIAARALGLHGFGILILVQTFAEAIGEVGKFQSWQTVLRYGTKPLGDGDIAEFQRVLRFTGVLDLIGSVAGVAIGMIGCVVVAPWLHWPAETVPVAMFFATSIAFMVTATPFGVLRLFGRFDLLATQVAIGNAFRLAGGAVAMAFHGDLAVFLAIWWGGYLAGFLFLMGAAWLELHRRGVLRGLDLWRGRLTAGFTGIWKFALTTNASATVAMAQVEVSTLLVGGLLNPAQAALWRIAEQLADAVASPANMMVAALYPELAKLEAAGEGRRLGRLAWQVALTIGSAGILLLVLTAVAGKTVLVLAMGKAFAAAAPVLTCQVAAVVIAMWTSPLEPLLISTGHAGVTLKTRLVVAVCYLAGLSPLVRHFGVIGAGLDSIGASLLLGGGMLLGVIRWRKDLGHAPLSGP